MAATTYSGATNLQGYPLRLVVDFTQNVAGNYSDVSWNLYLDRPAGQADFSNWQSSWSVNIGGNAYGGYISSYDFRQYSTFWLGTGTTRIYHDASGDALINVSGAFAESHALIGNASVGGSYDLPIIPRASQPTVDKTSIDAGQILTIFTNRASTAFTHTVKYTFGTQTGTVLTNVTDQVQWIPPLSLLTEIPNSTSGTMTITVDTFNGGTFVGWSSTTVTLKVPATVVPSFSTVTVSENNTTVSTAVGAYVQNLSRFNLAITGAAGAQGSTISSYKITVAGQTINAASGVTSAIANSGTVPIVGTITDSRGRTASKTVNATVLAYSVPAINGFTANRATSAGVIDANGTFLRIDLNAAVSSLVSGTQKNALTYTISTRVRGATTWTVKSNNIAPGGLTFNSNVLLSTYAVETAWEVKVDVKDKFSTATVQSTVATAAIFMHWATTGMGMGKFWERGGLDVFGQIYQNNGLAVLDTSDLATTSVQGIVELATLAEVTAGTDTTRVVTPAGLTSALNARDATTTGTFTFGTLYKQAASATWEPFTLVKKGNLVTAKGHIANTGSVTFAGSTIYQLGTLPTGYIPAKQTMRPIAVTPLTMGGAWMIAYPSGALSMAFQAGATISAADGWVIGFDVTWSIV
jgi:hypothetical protein